MASRSEEPPMEGRDEKGKSVGRRLLSRMRTVLRRTESSKSPGRLSLLSTTSAPPAAFRAQPDVTRTVPAAVNPPRYGAQNGRSPTVTMPSWNLVYEHWQDKTQELLVDTKSRSLPVSPEALALPEVDDSAPTQEGEKIPRSQIYNDRFQQFPKSLGLFEMDPSECYQMEGHVFRVNKTARMRVHRQCHQCNGDLSKTGQCEDCNHNYCRQCTRYPPKRTEAEILANRERKAEALRERSANPKIWPEPNFDPHAPVVVKRPARPEQELVYKKVRQRVRRTCCQCLEANGTEVIFHGGGRECPKCHHVRCTDCPRDPPKKDKYPYGYPGDAFGAKSTPHYRCHECYEKFPPGADNGTACQKCSHEKCDSCARMKPQKVEAGPDPDVVKSVQQKIAAMSVT